eukprot:CAMPEP_0198261246 /NCGR_PEP_ID=MMETSP1447-20131203/10003_1 /TAXON_ID=420782 /ORGANISM="Chaetoceros dichaeta, Strain CCMP1751" /LENGTH=105 /DNA_ID=CAMNT_0043949099 /DNA_START=406 /DNA_END=726 /DNA_ORIENTATION=-
MPEVYAWRAGSMGYMTEISTPVYNIWKLKKTKGIFAIFCVLFFLCRIVWVPIFLWGWLFRQSSPNFDWLLGVSSLFYALQLLFFAKMIKMLMKYDSSKERRKKAE